MPHSDIDHDIKRHDGDVHIRRELAIDRQALDERQGIRFHFIYLEPGGSKINTVITVDDECYFHTLSPGLALWKPLSPVR